MEGLVGYLKAQALQGNPSPFMAGLAKLLPLMLEGSKDAPIIVERVRRLPNLGSFDFLAVSLTWPGCPRGIAVYSFHESHSEFGVGEFDALLQGSGRFGERGAMAFNGGFLSRFRQPSALAGRAAARRKGRLGIAGGTRQRWAASRRRALPGGAAASPQN
jgi:hypothetical protein